MKIFEMYYEKTVIFLLNSIYVWLCTWKTISNFVVVPSDFGKLLIEVV